MIKVEYTFAKDPPKGNPFNTDILRSRLIELRRPVFDSLFGELECDNEEHKNFASNQVTVYLDNPESFVVENTCCSDFEQKIKNKLMKKN